MAMAFSGRPCMLAYRMIKKNEALIRAQYNAGPLTWENRNVFFVSGSETDAPLICTKQYLWEHFEREVILSRKLGRYVVRRK
jgi:hypothetical protein